MKDESVPKISLGSVGDLGLSQVNF